MISFLIAMLSLLMYIAIGFFMAIGFQLGEKSLPWVEEKISNIKNFFQNLWNKMFKPLKTA